MKKLLKLLTTFLLFSACSSKELSYTGNQQTFSAGFDTVIGLKAYTTNEQEYTKYFNAMQELFLTYNQLFDKYNNYPGINNIKTINDAAGIKSVEVDPILIDMLLLSREYSSISNNQFDVTMGAVLSLWHDVREKAESNQPFELPDNQVLQAAYSCSGWDKVEIDETNNTVYINQACASLDVGSVAKGYATELIANQLAEIGLSSAIINAGGNVRIIGSKPDGSVWKSGVRTPIKDANGMIGVVEITGEMSMVTSGDYERYFELEGRNYHHIIDPDTLFPSTHANSVTVLTKNSGIADILSTTFFTLTYQEGIDLVEKLEASGLEIGVIWAYRDTSEIEDADYESYLDIHTITAGSLAQSFKISKGV